MLTDPETQKLQAALEQLESERQRRIDERIEKGEVVRVLPVVVGLHDGSEAAKAAEVAKSQAAGETREVHFGQPMLDADGREIDRLAAIITGVPRVGRDRIPDSYLFSKPPAPPTSRRDRKRSARRRSRLRSLRRASRVVCVRRLSFLRKKVRGWLWKQLGQSRAM